MNNYNFKSLVLKWVNGEPILTPTFFLEVTTRVTYQLLPPPHQEATTFMPKWLFYLLNDHLEFETEYKAALLKGDSDR